MNQPVRDVFAGDSTAASFELHRGSESYTRGIPIRMIVRASGVVRPADGGTDVSIKFRPGVNALAWLTLGCLLTLLSLAALIITFVEREGPLLASACGPLLFGGTTTMWVVQLRSAKHQLDSDLVAWCSTPHDANLS